MNKEKDFYKRFIGLSTLTELLSKEHPNIQKLFKNIKTANETNNSMNKTKKIKRIKNIITSKLKSELQHDSINIYINKR